MKKQTLLGILLFTVSACQTETTPPVNLNYVSPAQYQGYNCKQIAREMQRISKKFDATAKTDSTTSQVLSSALTMYGMSQGYAFYEEGDGVDNSEVQRLKSSYDALEQLSIQKDCKE